MELVVKGQYEEGIEQLKLAYETLPHPNVLYNMGRAYVEMGEYEIAIDNFNRYLATEPADREDVKEVVARLKDTVERQRATLAAANQPGTPATPSAPAAPTTPGAPTPGAPNSTTTPAQPTTGPAVPAAPADIASAKTEDIYEQTVVTASRGQQSPLGAPNSTTIITSQDIRLSGITKIPELLRRVAGVDIMEITGGDTNVSIRGFNSRMSNKMMVLVDGRSVYVDVLGTTLWETLSIDVDQIERIEVVRGPGSALYGADAFSGVVNIITTPPGEGHSGVRVGVGDHMQTYGSARVVGKSGDLAYRVSTGYTRYPKWSVSVDPNRTDLYVARDDQLTASENYRLDIQATRRLGPKTVLELGGGTAQGMLEVSGIGVFYDMITQYSAPTANIQLKTENFRSRVFFNRFETSQTAMNANYFGQTNYDASVVSNMLDAEAEFFDTHRLGSMGNEIHVGLNYRLKQVDWMMLGGAHTENHAAIFMEDSLTPTDWLKFVLSGRLDYNPYLKSLRPSPRGSVIVSPTERQAVRLSAATAYRKAAFVEALPSFPLQLPFAGADGYYGSDLFIGEDAKVEPEKIFSLEAGYLNQESELFEWDLAAYWSRGTDFIDGAPFPLATPSNVLAGEAGYNPTTGRYTIAYGGLINECATRYIYGGEAGIRAYPTNGLDVFANYALTLNDMDKPPGCFAKPFDYQSKHKVNAGVQVRTRFGVSGEVTYHYQSKQVWTEMVTALGTTQVDYRDFPLPSVSLVNARVGYAFWNNQAEVSATAYNLLNKQHQQHPIGQLIGRRFMGFVSYKF